MPRYPKARWRPININFSRGGNRPRFLIVHIMQGTLAGTDSWFRNPASQVSAHFGNGRDGTLYQWVDTNDQAWHAADANSISIGVENEGNTGDQLTDPQIGNLARLLDWAHRVHPVPLHLASNPHGSGLAYHSLGGAAWGGHYQCPGRPIIRQLPEVLRAAEGGTPPQAPEELMYQPGFLLDGTDAAGNVQNTPIAVPNGAKRLRFFCNLNTAVRVDWVGVTSPSGELELSFKAGAQGFAIPDGCLAAVVHRPNHDSVPVSFVLTP